MHKGAIAILFALLAGDVVVAETNDVSTIVAGNTAFACDLYQQLRGEPGNLFLSPYNISAALAMTLVGARGETAGEIASALHYDLPAAQIHPAFAALRKKLAGLQQTNALEWLDSNSLWVQQRLITLIPESATQLRRDYGAQISLVDFIGNPTQAYRDINDCISRATKGHIRDFLAPRADNTETQVVLASAVYFRGYWQSRFQLSQTRYAPFYTTATNTVRAVLMSQTELFSYGESEDLQILGLPYIGQKVFMIVLLPKDKNGLTKLEDRLQPAQIAAWLKLVRRHEVEVYMPRFALDITFDLAGLLNNLGVKKTFDRQLADFSGFAKPTPEMPRLFLQRAVHRAGIQVDEVGTVAYAATATGLGGAGAAPPPPPVFRADHPFIYLIYDDTSRTILFMGRVTDPTKR